MRDGFTTARNVLLGAAIGSGLGILLFVGFRAVAGPHEGSDGPDPANMSVSMKPNHPKAAGVAPAPTKAIPRIGTAARDGDFEFTVTKVKDGLDHIGSAHMNKKAQGQYVEVYVTVRNIGKEARTFAASSQYAYDTEGRKFDTDSAAALYVSDSNSFLDDINPGNTSKGVIVFDIPKDEKITELEFHDAAFSGGVAVGL